MSAEAKLKEVGIDLPPPPAATANYVQFVREGDLLFVAGQGPFDAGGEVVYVGREWTFRKRTGTGRRDCAPSIV